MKEAMVKISENCSSWALQSVGDKEQDINNKDIFQWIPEKSVIL